MRLRTLQLENFRCFREVTLELNGMGLIGVRGRNGTGKSSLLEAVDFALYGQRGAMPARRDAAGTDEHLRVCVEFEFDARKVEVERTEHDASLTIDGEPRARGRDETTRQIARLLGLSRQQFASTFYARQKEIQSFADPGSRRPAIERLLGLTQLRRATELAQEQSKRQLVVVQTLQENAADPDEAKRTLSERREQVKQSAPLAVAARQRREQLQAQRAQAWEQLEEAQDLATQAEKARSTQRLAAAQHETALLAHQEAEAAALAAEQAAGEMQRLAPLAARTSELQAQVRELELQQQVHEQFISVREARAGVQRKRAALVDELQELPTPDQPADALRAQAQQLRSQRDQLSEDLLRATEKTAALVQQHDEAQRHGQTMVRLQQLERELSAIPAVQEEEERSRSAQATLEGERAELLHRLEAERVHRDEVQRDGPDAECPRCRRLYGDSFEAILKGFDATIEGLQAGLTCLEDQVTQARERHRQGRARLQELQRLEGERDSLRAATPKTSMDAAQALSLLKEAQGRQQRLRQALDQCSGQLSVLESQLEEATKRQDARQQVLEQLSQMQMKEELLSKQLEGMRTEDYDEEAHQQLVRDRHQALEASQRCAELRQQVEGRELAQRRRSACQKALEEAASKLSAANALVEEQEGDAEQLEAIKERLQEMDDLISRAEDTLRKAEQQAQAESQEVQAAEAAVKRALADRRKVQAARREHRYAETTAKALKQYTARAQRQAVPMLEKDTAEFLARLTANRYLDVLLDENGALEIFDDGAPRALKRFSGGEQDLANLCLRLALSRTFANQRRTDPGLIILDEVFGSQDLDRRKALLEHFRELNTVFSQVFIVSHFDDVADACDIQIQVQRSGKISTAQLLA